MHDIDDLALALLLADTADAMTMAAFTGQPIAFAEKDDATPVTETDRAVERELRGLVAHHRPSDGFLGEETGETDGARRRRWIIDPIDGTRSFCEGGRGWGTQIALEVDDELVVGVTSAPALRSRWWGDVASGAWERRGDRPVHSLRVSTGSATVRWSSNPDRDQFDRDGEALAHTLDTIGRYVPPRVHPALSLAGGDIEVCLLLDGWPWDYAAFAAIVRCAGGAFSYLDGSTELAGNRPAVLTNGMAHAAVLAAVQAVVRSSE